MTTLIKPINDGVREAKPKYNVRFKEIECNSVKSASPLKEDLQQNSFSVSADNNRIEAGIKRLVLSATNSGGNGYINGPCQTLSGTKTYRTSVHTRMESPICRINHVANCDYAKHLFQSQNERFHSQQPHFRSGLSVPLSIPYLTKSSPKMKKSDKSELSSSTKSTLTTDGDQLSKNFDFCYRSEIPDDQTLLAFVDRDEIISAETKHRIRQYCHLLPDHAHCSNPISQPRLTRLRSKLWQPTKPPVRLIQSEENQSKSCTMPESSTTNREMPKNWLGTRFQMSSPKFPMALPEFKFDPDAAEKCESTHSPNKLNACKWLNMQQRIEHSERLTAHRNLNERIRVRTFEKQQHAANSQSERIDTFTSEQNKQDRNIRILSWLDKSFVIPIQIKC